MDIGRKDKIICILQDKLKNLQNNQIEQMKNIGEKLETNTLLEDVYSDYKQYFNYMIDMKRKQQMQIKQLISYLEKSMEQAEITQTLFNQAKYEKRGLIRKIDEIREEINEMIMADTKLLGK